MAGRQGGAKVEKGWVGSRSLQGCPGEEDGAWVERVGEGEGGGGEWRQGRREGWEGGRREWGRGERRRESGEGWEGNAR